MDGNRRYARLPSSSCSTPLDGHRLGFDKLLECLDWCLELGVKIVTVYAFSMDNFKRSKTEVDGLLRLSQEKFTEMLQKQSIINQYSVCIRILGNTSFLPQELRMTMEKAVNASRNNTNVYLNIAMPYTTQQEITDAANQILKGINQKNHSVSGGREEGERRKVERCTCRGKKRIERTEKNGEEIQQNEEEEEEEGEVTELKRRVKLLAEEASSALRCEVSSSSSSLPPSSSSVDPIPSALDVCDLSSSLFSLSLYTASTPPPCIVIRTSGETRLSDFLLYQSVLSGLHFIKVYWPEFTFWQMAKVIVEYQKKEKWIKEENEKMKQWNAIVEREDEKERQKVGRKENATEPVCDSCHSARVASFLRTTRSPALV